MKMTQVLRGLPDAALALLRLPGLSLGPGKERLEGQGRSELDDARCDRVSLSAVRTCEVSSVFSKGCWTP